MQPIHEYTNAIYCLVFFNSLQHPSFKLKPPLRENQSNNAAWQYSYKTNNADNAGSTDNTDTADNADNADNADSADSADSADNNLD